MKLLTLIITLTLSTFLLTACGGLSQEEIEGGEEVNHQDVSSENNSIMFKPKSLENWLVGKWRNESGNVEMEFFPDNTCKFSHSIDSSMPTGLYGGYTIEGNKVSYSMPFGGIDVNYIYDTRKNPDSFISVPTPDHYFMLKSPDNPMSQNSEKFVELIRTITYTRVQ